MSFSESDLRDIQRKIGDLGSKWAFWNSKLIPDHMLTNNKNAFCDLTKLDDDVVNSEFCELFYGQQHQVGTVRSAIALHIRHDAEASVQWHSQVTTGFREGRTCEKWAYGVTIGQANA
jgi:hypothetical protein